MYNRLLGCCTTDGTINQVLDVSTSNHPAFNPGVSSIASHQSSQQSYILTPEGHVKNSTVWKSTAVAQPVQIMFTYSNRGSGVEGVVERIQEIPQVPQIQQITQGKHGKPPLMSARSPERQMKGMTLTQSFSRKELVTHERRGQAYPVQYGERRQLDFQRKSPVNIQYQSIGHTAIHQIGAVKSPNQQVQIIQKTHQQQIISKQQIEIQQQNSITINHRTDDTAPPQEIPTQISLQQQNIQIENINFKIPQTKFFKSANSQQLSPREKVVEQLPLATEVKKEMISVQPVEKEKTFEQPIQEIRLDKQEQKAIQSQQSKRVQLRGSKTIYEIQQEVANSHQSPAIHTTQNHQTTTANFQPIISYSMDSSQPVMNIVFLNPTPIHESQKSHTFVQVLNSPRSAEQTTFKPYTFQNVSESVPQAAPKHRYIPPQSARLEKVFKSPSPAKPIASQSGVKNKSVAKKKESSLSATQAVSLNKTQTVKKVEPTPKKPNKFISYIQDRLLGHRPCGRRYCQACQARKKAESTITAKPK